MSGVADPSPSRSVLEEHELYQAVLAAQSELGEGVCLVDIETQRYHWANDAFCRMYGYTVEELLALPSFWTPVAPEDFGWLEENRKRRLAGKEVPDRFEVGIVRKDGRRIQVEMAVRGLREPNEQLFLALVRDTTQSARVQAALEQTRESFRAQYQGLPVPSYTWRRSGDDFVLSDYNDAAHALTRGGVEELLGRTASDIYPDMPEVRADLERCFTQRVSLRREMDMRLRTTGEDKRVVTHYVWVPPDMVMVHAEDVTERVHAVRALEEAEERYRTLVERLPALTYVFDPGPPPRATFISPQVEEMLGFSQEDWLADPEAWVHRLHPEDRDWVLSERAAAESSGRALTLEYRMVHRDGSVIWVRDEAVPHERPDGGRDIEGMVLDITERKQFEAKLRHLAEHDGLTGLYNRRRFSEEVALELRLARRDERRSALLVLDLDNFKYVNDSLGHQAGDDLIRCVAGALGRRLRESDTLARLGGDEFAALLRGADADAARGAAADLLEAVREHAHVVGSEPIRISASVGVAALDPERTAEEALAEADLAMYEAKRTGRDRVALYSPDLQSAMASGRSWADRVRAALEEDGFLLYAQPIIDVQSGDAAQFEILLRMRGEDGEVIPPDAFLGVAERFDLIQAVDRWVVGEAIALMERRRAEGRPLRLTVNLSGKSMGDPELLASVAGALERTAIDPGTLVFEVTETTAIANMEEARDFSEQLSKLGCGLALDDFGSGFGSFFYLKHLPVQYLKIDGDFIRNLTSSRVDQEVVKAIVHLAGSVGQKTVAEFVGDDATLALLREYGVDYAQGFHLGLPRPVDEI